MSCTKQLPPHELNVSFVAFLTVAFCQVIPTSWIIKICRQVDISHLLICGSPYVAGNIKENSSSITANGLKADRRIMN